MTHAGQSKIINKIGLSGLLIVLVAVTATAAKVIPRRMSPPSASAQRLAILTTPDNGSDTYLHLLEVGRPFPPSTATLRHLPGAVVKGTVLPDGSIAVVADNEPGRDRSFGSALFRMASGTDPVLLCENVVFASKPIITSDGRILVQRGRAGSTTQDGETRVDPLSIDEIDPTTGTAKTLWRTTGYFAYIAGTFQNDVIIYHIQPSGARLILIDRGTGAERVILSSLPPYAGDFSVTDKGDLIFEDKDENSDLSVIERFSLTSGSLERLNKERTALAPRAWPHGEVTWNSPLGLK